MVTSSAVITYAITNAVIALVSIWFIEPLRLALKEMSRRDVIGWVLSSAILLTFFWLVLR